MKKWLRLGLVISLILFIIRYLGIFIFTRFFNINNVGDFLAKIIIRNQFPPNFVRLIITSLVIGFFLGIIISLFSKNKY